MQRRENEWKAKHQEKESPDIQQHNRHLSFVPDVDDGFRVFRIQLRAAFRTAIVSKTTLPKALKRVAAVSAQQKMERLRLRWIERGAAFGTAMLGQSRQ